MTDYLKQICDNLAIKDKVEVRDYLSDAIAASRDGVMKSPLRCSILLGEMAQVLGVDYIPYEGRTPAHVWARTFVAYQMILEGYSTIEIGDQMCKDHSTIIHMRKKMQDALSLPNAYGDILELWDKFQKQIHNDIHN